MESFAEVWWVDHQTDPALHFNTSNNGQKQVVSALSERLCQSQ